MADDDHNDTSTESAREADEHQPDAHEPTAVGPRGEAEPEDGGGETDEVGEGQEPLFDPAAYQVPRSPEETGRLAGALLEEDERGRLHLPSRLNAHIGGRVTLHFATRDVVLLVDGATALRIVAHYRSPEKRELADVLNPHTASASNAWMSFDLQDPLAVSWQPDLASRSTRTTFDPPA